MTLKYNGNSFASANNHNNTLIHLVDSNYVANLKNHTDNHLSHAIENFKFEAKYKEILELKQFDGFKKVILLGVGDNILQKGNFKSIALGGFLYDFINTEIEIGIQAQLNLSHEDNTLLLQNVYEGLLIKSYHFDKYLTQEKPKIEQNLYFLNTKDLNLNEVACEVEGVNFAKTLINEPANVIYPKAYVETILELQSLGIKVKVLDKQELEKLEMRSLLSVSLGNVNDPYVVVLEYMGDPSNKQSLALVGKGVTFDSGGYSLKPATGMMTMKSDMSGSACVCGVLKTLALRKAKTNVIGVVGLVENMVNSLSNKPGDIIKAKNGKTIEVLNTDAEGRLVLADLLYYTQSHFNPSYTINIATLTGAIVVSLGDQRAGLFSNDEKLIDLLLKSGEQTGELLWNMPISEEYAHYLKSPIADLQNITTNPRSAGAIFGAMFLKEFVNETPWAHLDIAGVAFNSSKSDLNKIGASGFGVRLLNNLIKQNFETK